MDFTYNNRPVHITGILITLLFAIYSSACAQPSSSDILRVKFYYDSVEFERAISTGKSLLNSNRQISPEGLAFLHQYIALSFYSIGRLDSARSHFLSLLSLDPDRELDPVNISPKIIEFFNTIKEDFQAISGKTDQITFTKYIVGKDLRPGAGWRSIIVPGWGQFHKHQKTRGVLLGGVFWGSLLATGVARIAENQAHDKYLDSQSLQDFNENYSTYNNWYKLRRSLTVAAIVAWSVTLADALWSSYPRPSVAVSQDGNLQLGIRFNLN